MDKGIFSHWRERAAKNKVDPAGPARIDEDALARGAEIEEYTVGDPAKALSTALKNLQEDPHHYDASVRELWMMRRSDAGWMEIAAPKVLNSYKRDRKMGLTHERAMEHSLANWKTVIDMRRGMNGEQPVSEADVAALTQRLEQMIAAEGDLGPTASLSKTAKDAARDYSCVMVNVTDADVKRQFHEIVASIPDEDVYDPPGSEKFGREDRPHVTVKYGLHTGDADDVRPLVEGFGHIEAEIEGVSFFRKEGKDYDVLKFDIKSDDLRRLREKIEGALESTDEHPEYRPHMTIACLKRGTAEKYADDKVFADLAKDKLQGSLLTFDKVCFSDKGSDKVEITCVKTVLSKRLMHLAKAKKNPAYVKETEKINENKKKPEAKKPHDFKPAKWTHPNGHPRCLICGDEETIGGRCNVTPSAKDYRDFEKELDAEFPGRKERQERDAALFEKGEITYTDFRRRSAMGDDAERLLSAFYAGEITHTDLQQGLDALRVAS